MPYIFPHSAVNTDYFTDNNASGGSGGTTFDFIRSDQGAILKKIKAWKQQWRLRGVEVWMSDGSSHLAGKREGDTSSEFQFEGGEYIKKLNVQASGELSSGGYRRLGAIWFQTNKSREWGIFSDNLKEDGRYWPEVGSGICCGIFGANGDDMDRLGFAMLREIDYAMLTNVTYPNLSMQIVATTPDTVAQNTYKNGTSIVQSYELSGEKDVTITRQWGMSATLSYSMTVSVSAGIPVVGQVNTEMGWTVSGTSTYEVSTSYTEKQSWKWPIQCPPYMCIYAEGTMYADKIDTEYEADMELHLVNQKVYSYKEKGVYNGLNSRSGTLTIKELGPYPPTPPPVRRDASSGL